MDVQSALLEVVTILEDGLKESLKSANKVSSGRTLDAIETQATESHAQLLGPDYIYALQDGRKPTSDNAPAGNPTLFEMIQEWCAENGIDQSAAYPITKQIHKYGYPGVPGIIDEPLSDENVDKALDKALGDISNLFANTIADNLQFA